MIDNMSLSMIRHMSDYMKKRRLNMGFSLKDLADKANVSKTHIYDLECGNSKNPSFLLVLAICDALECGMQDIMGKEIEGFLK